MSRRRYRCLIEEAIAASEDEIMLVPEAIPGVQSEMIGNEIADGIVVSLGPLAHRL